MNYASGRFEPVTMRWVLSVETSDFRDAAAHFTPTDSVGYFAGYAVDRIATDSGCGAAVTSGLFSAQLAQRTRLGTNPVPLGH